MYNNIRRSTTKSVTFRRLRRALVSNKCPTCAAIVIRRPWHTITRAIPLSAHSFERRFRCGRNATSSFGSGVPSKCDGDYYCEPVAYCCLFRVGRRNIHYRKTGRHVFRIPSHGAHHRRGARILPITRQSSTVYFVELLGRPDTDRTCTKSRFRR